MTEILRLAADDTSPAVVAAVLDSLRRCGASPGDQALAVATLWRALPAEVILDLVEDRLRLTAGEATLSLHLAGLPAGPPDPEPDPGAAATWLMELISHLQSQLQGHQEELDRTDRGTLELHAELSQISERLRLAGEEQTRALEAERQARAAAEAARSRLSFLAHAGATLSASLDHAHVLGRLEALVTAQNVAELGVWLLEGETLRDRTPSTPPAVSTAPPPIASRALQRESTEHATPHPPLHTLGVTSSPASEETLAVPLISRGRALGVLTFRPLVAPFNPDDLAVYRELTRLSAVALDNAARFEREHDVAQQLQRAMLTDLPSPDSLEFQARYVPAEAGLNVGGDWYDAFARPDGHTIAVIGDVTGHGLRAATMMGSLRTALRAYAIDATAPGVALSRLHRLMSHLQPDDLATALLADLAPDGEVTWANAGHLPPLLRRSDGQVQILHGGDPLLGAPSGDIDFQTRRTSLSPGSTLLLYTDGLVERRTSSIPAGLQRLANVFGAAQGHLGQVADQILDHMLADSSLEDDTCLLLCRLAHTPAYEPARRTHNDLQGELSPLHP